MRVLVASALCLSLAGCFSLTGPKPIPEWAMGPEAASVDEPQPKARRKPVAYRVPAVRTTVDIGTVVTQPAGLSRAALRAQTVVQADPADPPPYTAEWQAREDAADDRLLRSMNICRGC